MGWRIPDGTCYTCTLPARSAPRWVLTCAAVTGWDILPAKAVEQPGHTCTLPGSIMGNGWLPMVPCPWSWMAGEPWQDQRPTRMAARAGINIQASQYAARSSQIFREP